MTAAAIARIVLNIKLDREFHYSVPKPLLPALQPGMRVRVPFRNEVKAGFFVGFADKAEAPYLKDISAVLDEAPLATPTILTLTRWMADRYLCSWGTALSAAIPPGARRASARRTIPYVEAAPEGSPPRKSEKQEQVLAFLRAAKAPVPWRALASRTGAARSVVDRLAELGLVRWRHVRQERDLFTDLPAEPSGKFSLTPEQSAALERIEGLIDSRRHAVALLHGVTGSGKTEVYLRAMDRALRSGRTAILLVPEVALTPQTVGRVRARFQDVCVLHSTLAESERAEAWRFAREGGARIVVGARSALFAPLPDVGLIVVDEEHEPTYKQDAAPRYHARDAAIERARIDGAVVVLGSATPSVEAYHRARTGEFELLELPRRVGGLRMPEIRVVDMAHESKGPPSVLSKGLKEAVGAALARKEQAILFLNRRGYATYARCPACSWVARCDRCDSSLNYHRDLGRWQCHYCLADRDLPIRCPQCGAGTLRPFGLGTQKAEEEARRAFPQARIGRMDSDAMRTEQDYRASLENWKRGEVDILVGTQMIAKGLDVPGVTVVGVVSADTAFHVPDFRAAERTFQLIVQVAGRAGRSSKGGAVYVQTVHPAHPAIVAAARYDYAAFVERELRQREEAGYPPFTRLVRALVEGHDEPAVKKFAEQVGERLRTELPRDSVEVLGPSVAPLGKVRNRHRHHLLIKCADLSAALPPLKRIEWREPARVSLTLDVDPYSLF